MSSTAAPLLSILTSPPPLALFLLHSEPLNHPSQLQKPRKYPKYVFLVLYQYILYRNNANYTKEKLYRVQVNFSPQQLLLSLLTPPPPLFLLLSYSYTTSL